MAAGRPGRPNDPSVMSSLEFAVRPLRRPGPIESAWNWRWEIWIVFGTAGLSAFVAVSLGFSWLAAGAGAGLAAVCAMMRWPPARKRILARAWCVITPHRVRTGCVNAWVQTRRGRLPFVLSTVPTDYGERVQLWCRAGITAADLFAARHVLAAACWASEVRVIASVRYAHIVTLEVIRNHRRGVPGGRPPGGAEPERSEPTLPAWPFSRRVEGDARDDSEEPDPAGWWGDQLSAVNDRVLQGYAPVSSPREEPERTDLASSWATSMTSRSCLASPLAFLALTASPSMTRQ